ncbi:MAG: glycosyltransferase [Bacteroidia bacterium]|jgi:hypothetical protein
MVQYLNTFFLLYGLFITLSYVVLAFISAAGLYQYIWANRFVHYENLLSTENAPSLSLIAPAYNEEKTIVENIRSLLSLHYNNLEIIIVNDGSKDLTFQKVVDAYEMTKVPFYIREAVHSKPIRGIYKSTNPAYSKLILVDKVNGGKADALNAGINISSFDIITCIDVDCILEQDGLLKMVKPFLESREQVIAVGGVIRIANSCEIEDGRLIKTHIPEEMVPRFQVIEYLRAFLMGRMGWSRMNALLLISGALGMFDKRIAIAVGGYNHDTVGEDMELVVRMRRYMADNKKPYRVVYIPDPLCWTEAPSDYKVLGRQRNRWMRGTMETLWTHRKMFMNPRYGILGFLSFPYWMLFEWLAPLIEAVGLLYFLTLILFGFDQWYLFIILSGTVYFASIAISFLALLFEEFTYHQYQSKRETLLLILTAMIEPFVFHPRSSWWGIKGNIDKIRGQKSWGEMTRAGFAKKK